MDLPDLVKTIRKGWLLILVGLVAGVGAGLGLTAITEREYTATTKLFVSVRTSDSSSAADVSQGSAAAQQKVRSYTEVATSASVLQPVITKLGLDVTPAALARQVEATTPVSSVVMTISVTDRSATAAAEIANAIGASFSTYVSELETPTEGGASQVKVADITSAVVPAAPSSPNRTVNVGVGALLGLLLGFVSAVLRSMLDTRVHGPRDVAAVTGAPVLGTIGFDALAGRRPLIVQSEPRSPLAEAFRALRTNLQFVDLTSSGGSFVVTSAMPSEGKTTTTANLAIAIAETGAKVVLIDADLRRPRLAQVMGIEGGAGLTDLLIGRAELDDVVQPWGTGSLSVLPAGLVPPNPSELLGSAAMRALLDILTAEFDYVLIDAPPTLPVTDAAVLSTVTAGAIIVTAARQSRRSQLQAAIANIDRLGSRILGVVVTKIPARGAREYGNAYGSYGTYYGRVAEVDLATVPERAGGRRERQNEAAPLPSIGAEALGEPS